VGWLRRPRGAGPSISGAGRPSTSGTPCSPTSSRG
jgi:hypothetical protein